MINCQGFSCTQETYIYPNYKFDKYIDIKTSS